ncbi:unnamed protein product, partial [Prorocentrum cordatum]
MVQLVAGLLDRGAPLADKTRDLILQNTVVQPGGQSALHLAARAGEVEVAELLLARRADPAALDLDGISPVHKVFPFSDPARVGVIEFETEASKIGFYKKIRNVSKQVSENLKLWFTNNRTYKQRLRDKTLGRIKHWLIEKKGCDPEDVQIAWKS